MAPAAGFPIHPNPRHTSAGDGPFRFPTSTPLHTLFPLSVMISFSSG